MFWSRDLFEDMRKMQEEMDKMFARVFSTTDMPMLEHEGSRSRDLTTAGGSRGLWRTPRAELNETESSLVATFELPGVDKKDIELNVTDKAIEVKVEKQEEEEQKDEKKGTYSYSAQRASFYRNLPLYRDVDADKASAEFRNGVLKVEVPKKERDKPKKKLEIK